jgi:putative nucleotidyltransferase with HDIG domain
VSIIDSQIGNYRVTAEIGRGAMGHVYAAEHVLMGRRAAVKVIRDELAMRPDIVKRFINEAKTIHAIGHPNIVDVTDVGVLGTRHYIVMELLEGETLQQRLQRSYRLTIESAVHITLQIASALGAAHELHVVHRDLKPDNVFLTARGSNDDFVKVLDFGVAKLAFDETASASSSTPGMIVGTPQYMSPEQCMGAKSLDHRSDIYSLGIVLYRMLTGRLPYAPEDNDNFMRCLIAHINEAPQPPRTLVPELPGHLESVVLRALAKKPEDRFASMSDFARALAPIADISSAIATVISQEQRSFDSELASKIVPDNDQPQRMAGKLARIVMACVQSGTLRLPSLPAATVQGLELLRKPDCAVPKLAEVLGRDPIIAPQILRQANSAARAGANRARSLEQAIARIGNRALSALLVELSARQLFDSRTPAIRRAFRDLWDHSVAVAVVARGLAIERRYPDPQIAYLAGLLHDVGKPVTAAVLLEGERVAPRAHQHWFAADSWLSLVSECHREVGFAMARAWQLPDEVLFAIARSDRFSVDGELSPVNIVCLANALVKREGIYPQPVDRAAVQALIDEGQRLFGLDEPALARVLQLLRAHVVEQKTIVAEARG